MSTGTAIALVGGGLLAAYLLLGRRPTVVQQAPQPGAQTGSNWRDLLRDIVQGGTRVLNTLIEGQTGAGGGGGASDPWGFK